MSRHDPAHTHDLVGARLRARGMTGKASIAHKCAPTQAVTSRCISTVGARSRAMGPYRERVKTRAPLDTSANTAQRLRGMLTVMPCAPTHRRLSPPDFASAHHP